MHNTKNLTVGGSILTLALLATTICAQSEDVSRLGGGNPNSPIAQAVTVPEGFKTFYISGAPGGPTGDTHAQTVSSLAKIKDTLTALGLTFGDVVKATVFLVGDPAKDGEIDFPAMNQAWSEQFGTAQQPNKPARSTIKVAGLAGKGALGEIEMIAVKKN
jgi:enamine deaminase RidA (YjgF/YER057c/UK114 family)